jgi:hypothetical protein
MPNEAVPYPDATLNRQDFSNRVQGWIATLEILTDELKIDPNSVTRVSELAAGEGRVVAAMLKVFPNAQIDMVDYFGYVSPFLREDPEFSARVIPYKGRFEDIIPSLSPPDLALLVFPGTVFHLTEEIGQALQRYIGRNGLLYTEDDTGETGKLGEYFENRIRRGLNMNLWVGNISNIMAES